MGIKPSRFRGLGYQQEQFTSASECCDDCCLPLPQKTDERCLKGSVAGTCANYPVMNISTNCRMIVGASRRRSKTLRLTQPCFIVHGSTVLQRSLHIHRRRVEDLIWCSFCAQQAYSYLETLARSSRSPREHRSHCTRRIKTMCSQWRCIAMTYLQNLCHGHASSTMEQSSLRKCDR